MHVRILRVWYRDDVLWTLSIYTSEVISTTLNICICIQELGLAGRRGAAVASSGAVLSTPLNEPVNAERVHDIISRVP